MTAKSFSRRRLMQGAAALGTAAEAQTVAGQLVVSGLSRPTFVTAPPGDFSHHAPN